MAELGSTPGNKTKTWAANNLIKHVELEHKQRQRTAGVSYLACLSFPCGVSLPAAPLVSPLSPPPWLGAAHCLQWKALRAVWDHKLNDVSFCVIKSGKTLTRGSNIYSTMNKMCWYGLNRKRRGRRAELCSSSPGDSEINDAVPLVPPPAAS